VLKKRGCPTKNAICLNSYQKRSTLRVVNTGRYDLGLIGGALLDIRDALHTTVVVEGIIVGVAKFGAFFGTFLGGALMLYYGRRPTIALDTVFFVLGPVVMATAQHAAYAALSLSSCIPLWCKWPVTREH
jgi:MFS family permease